MPSGSLYRAISRTGGIQPVVDLIKDISEKKQRVDEYNRIMDAFGRTGNVIGGLNNATGDRVSVEAENPFYKPEEQSNPLDILGFGNRNKERLSNLTSNVPKGLAGLDPNVMAKEFTGPKTYQKEVDIPLPQQEKYNRAQDEVNNFLVQSITNPNSQKIDPGVIRALTGILSGQAERLKPETYNYSDEDPTKRVVRVSNKTGKREVVSEGTPKKNTKVIDERLDERGHKIVEFEDEQGKRFVEDKGLDYKFIADQRRQDAADRRFEKTIELREKKEGKKSKLTTSTAQIIADIKNPKLYLTDDTGNVKKFKVDGKGNFIKKDGEFVEDSEGKPMKLSDDEMKYKKENARQNLMLQLLGSRAYDFVNNIESSWQRKLTPAELTSEAIKHAEAGDLTDDEAGEIADFLPYYKMIYSGIK